MAEDIIDILVTNYNDNVTLELDPAVTVVNISNLSGLTGIIIPSGTIGRLPYYDTASTFADSNIYTTGTIVGINNDTPTLYSTNKGMVVRNPAGNVELLLQHDGNTANSIQGFSFSTVKTDAAYIFQRENLPLKIGTNDTARISILGGGRILMGSTLPSDDAATALQVNGAGKFVNGIGINRSPDLVNNYGVFSNGGTSGTFYRAYTGATETFRISTTGTHSTVAAFEGDLRFDTKDLGNVLILASTTGDATFISKITSTKIKFTALPTSASGLSTGDVWNDSGTLKIV